MKETKLEIGSVTLEATLWDTHPEWDRVAINYVNHGNNCGDASHDVSTDISRAEATEIVRFLLVAYPEMIADIQ